MVFYTIIPQCKVFIFIQIVQFGISVCFNFYIKTSQRCCFGCIWYFLYNNAPVRSLHIYTNGLFGSNICCNLYIKASQRCCFHYIWHFYTIMPHRELFIFIQIVQFGSSICCNLYIKASQRCCFGSIYWTFVFFSGCRRFLHHFGTSPRWWHEVKHWVVWMRSFDPLLKLSTC